MSSYANFFDHRQLCTTMLQWCCIDAALLHCQRWIPKKMSDDAVSMQMQWYCIDANATMLHHCIFFFFFWKMSKLWKFWQILKFWTSLQNATMQHHYSIDVASLQYYGNTNITSSDAASLCTIGHVHHQNIKKLL